MYAGAKIFNVFTMESHWIYHTAKKNPKTKNKTKKKKETKQDKAKKNSHKNKINEKINWNKKKKQ